MVRINKNWPPRRATSSGISFARSHANHRPAVKFTPDQRKILEQNKFAREFPYPQWTSQEEMLVDWFIDYVSKRTITKSIYNNLMLEVEKGPRGPKAVSKELQITLNQAHYLVEGFYLNLESQQSLL